MCSCHNSCDGRPRPSKQECPLVFVFLQRKRFFFASLTFWKTSCCCLWCFFNCATLLSLHGKLVHDKVCTQLQHRCPSSGKSSAHCWLDFLRQTCSHCCGHRSCTCWSRALLLLWRSPQGSLPPPALMQSTTVNYSNRAEVLNQNGLFIGVFQLKFWDEVRYNPIFDW